MTGSAAAAVTATGRRTGSLPQEQRPRRVAISCVFGDPLHPRTWSGAPSGIAAELRRLGVAVHGIAPRIGRAEKLLLAARHLLARCGPLRSTEQLLRQAPSRRRRAATVAAAARQLDVADVLHMGTLDLPAPANAAARHHIYCDQTWDLSLRHRPDATDYPPRLRQRVEQLEREAFAGAARIFTFGAYVRDNLIGHYGLAPERVIVVGSGMGGIEPFRGPKDYGRPRLLFVAKHLFVAKGGALLLDAFRLARQHKPGLRLTIVGSEQSRRFVPDDPDIDFRAHIPWAELQQLYRDATLLVQPMLNDPWGQVYLEALVSRTPVIGLDRNGLPEIVQGGRHGFLVDRAEPAALATRILEALGDPSRLAAMGESGQRHVQQSYSWERVARRIALSMA